MGHLTTPEPVMLFVAAFSRYDDALDWARQRVQAQWGPLRDESPRFEFRETQYYAPSMGAGLVKTFWAMERKVDPGQLPQIKRLTNEWEAEYAAQAARPEPRPLNLDPGYLTLAKLVLASTKDHAHRLYLADGVFAEITLAFRAGRWQSQPWTYPDYQRADFQDFFTRCRASLRTMKET